MVVPIKKTAVLLLAFLLFSALKVSADTRPSGFWTLDNTDDQMPYGGLKFDHSGQFKLMLYDDNCQLHTVEGGVRQKNNNSWELKSAVDYSNVFILTKTDNKLKLVDTEGMQLLFSASSKEVLQRGLKEHSCRAQKKPEQKSNNKADK